MLLVGLYCGKYNFTGQVDMLFQFLCAKIIAEQEIDIFVVFNRTEHMLFVYEIVLIPKEKNGLCRIICIAHSHIAFYIVVVRIGIEQFFQTLRLVISMYFLL